MASPGGGPPMPLMGKGLRSTCARGSSPQTSELAVPPPLPPLREKDATSATYDTCRRPLDLDDLLSRIERLCFQRGCPASDLRLLDVGAGSGNYYQRMRERGCMVQYHGLDFSQGMLDQVSVSSLLFSSHLSSLSLSLVSATISGISGRA